MKLVNTIAWVAVVVLSFLVMSSMTSAMSVEAAKVVGNGSKHIAVAYGNGTFVEVWYSYDGAYFNATAINSTTGGIVKTKTISKDVYIHNNHPSINPAIIYIPGLNGFMVTWVNSTNYSEAMVIDSNLNVVYPEMTVNDSTGVSYRGIAVGFDGKKVLFVWSDSNGYLEGRFMNDTYQGNAFRISTYNSEQKYPSIAYDSHSGNYMVVWVNHTSEYNITGKIINANTMQPISGDIPIATVQSSSDSFTSPYVAAGNGEFFVTYVNYNSPYNITAKIFDSNGSLITNKPISIGTTYKYGKSSMPVTFNGTDFIVAWSNENESIITTSYNLNGTMVTSKVVYNGTNGGNPVIAYDSDNKGYFFGWTEYQGSGKPYKLSSTILTNDEFVPEFNFVAPILAVAAVSLVIVRRKH